jgi:hypothetical protein
MAYYWVDSMKVLVTGRCIPQQPDRCTAQQLVEGFKQAGHEAIFYGNFYEEPYRFLGAKEAREEEFDLLIVTEMNDGMSGYSSLFYHHNLKYIPRLYWDFDVSYHPEQSFKKAFGDSYHGYLVANKLFVDRFKERTPSPVLHLPYACSPQIHRRKPEILKQFTIGFVGSITAEREKLLEKVRCVNGVFGEALIDETNQLYTMIHINQDACRGLVPGRPWETAGCGTNLLMDRASYEDFKEFIPDFLDDSVQCFDSFEQLERMIKDVEFCHPNRLKEMRENGQRLMEYMHANHSYKNRAETIISWCKDNEIL